VNNLSPAQYLRRDAGRGVVFARIALKVMRNDSFNIGEVNVI